MEDFWKVLVIAVLAAALVAALICYFRPCPSLETADMRPPPTCQELIARETHEAAVVVAEEDTADRRCKLKTYPKELPTCVGDLMHWQAAPLGNCSGYAGEMQIKMKRPEHADYYVPEPSDPGTAQGRIARWPETCTPGRKCYLPYSVTLHQKDSSGDPLVEDPRIVVWP